MSFQDIALIFTSTVFVGTFAYIGYILCTDPIDSKEAKEWEAKKGH